MSESTRPATADDVSEVVALLEEGRAGIADARGGAMWLQRQAIPGPLPEAATTAIADESWLVQLSLIDDVPLGVLIVERETVRSQTVAVVRELFVLEAARGVGLGELMMDATMEWARAVGAVGVDGYALPGDRATKNFFETFGLVARGIVVHRAIAP